LAAGRAPAARALAEAHHRQARALADDLGRRPLQAHGHLGLGTREAEPGQRAPAPAALSTASDRDRALDLTCGLPQAEAALTQVDGP
jgi:hypothetical protein